MSTRKIFSAIAVFGILGTVPSQAQMWGSGTQTGTGEGAGSSSGSGAGTGTGIDSNTGTAGKTYTPTDKGMDTGRSRLDTHLGTGPGGTGDNIGTTSGTYDDTTAPVKTPKKVPQTQRSVPNPPAGTSDTGPASPK